MQTVFIRAGHPIPSEVTTLLPDRTGAHTFSVNAADIFTHEHERLSRQLDIAFERQGLGGGVVVGAYPELIFPCAT